MPMDRSKYPKNWEKISLRVRESAGWKCQFCRVAQGRPHWKNGKAAVMTVAHLDHDTTHNSDDNLACLCRVCHLRYDVDFHTQTRRRKRIERLINSGQMWLFSSASR